MSSHLLKYFLCLFCFISVLGCQGNSSSKRINSSYQQYGGSSSIDIDVINRATIDAILNSSTPVIKQKKDTLWEKGYEYGWDAGYEDAVNGEAYLYSFDESNKGGKFLDGYSYGYDDGYSSGKKERRDYYDNGDSDDMEEYEEYEE